MRRQVWALSCYPLCQPPHKPTISMQWCTLASAQPRTFSWGCLAQTVDLDVIKPLETTKKLWAMYWKQLGLRVLSCHPTPSCLHAAPLVCCSCSWKGVTNTGLYWACSSELLTSVNSGFPSGIFVLFSFSSCCSFLMLQQLALPLHQKEQFFTVLVEECGGGDLVWRNWLHQGKIRI